MILHPETDTFSASAENAPNLSGPSLDLLCFSHLRWHFVTQRPQHLLTRCAKDRRVFFWEEP
jgi:UDP-galactopyranose mutase